MPIYSSASKFIAFTKNLKLMLCMIIISTIIPITTACSAQHASKTEENFAKTFPTPPEGQGGLYIVRDSYFFGWARVVNLFVDGQKVANMGNGDFLYITLPVGSHSVLTSVYGGVINSMINGYDDLEAEGLKVKIEENKNKFVELVYSNLTLRPLSETEGKKLVQKCSKVVEVKTE